MRSILLAAAVLLGFLTTLDARRVALADCGHWETLASMQTARQEVGAARLGDSVYVVGGLSGPPLQALDTVERYDIALNQWSFVAALPVPLDHMAVVALDGLLYAIGGFSGDFRARTSVLVYDPIANSWANGPALPAPRGAPWAVSHQGKIYLFGGVDVTGQATSTTFIFDPTLSQWTRGANMPTTREHLNAVSLGDFIYVIGGRSGGSTGANERYHAASNQWQTMAPMPTARSAAAVAAFGGKVYVAGGEVPQLFAVNEVYDVGSNSWGSAPPMPLPRHGIAAVALDDRILTPAGGTKQGLEPTSTVDSFVPGSSASAPPTPVCAATPEPCRTPAVGGKSLLILRDGLSDARDRLAWTWLKGAATAKSEFGDPSTTDTYELCLYDATGLRARATAPADDACAFGIKPAWKETRHGFSYVDRTLTPDGLSRFTLRAGTAGKARISVQGNGTLLEMPTLGAFSSPLTVQLKNSAGICWQATYGFPPAIKNDATQFRDRAD